MIGGVKIPEGPGRWYSDVEFAAALREQREAIVDKIEEMALAILSDPEGDDAGAPIAAAILRQAAEVARWAHPETLAS